jgi:hypothetical protein
VARPAQGKPPADVIGDAAKPDGVVADMEPETRVKRAAAELASRGGKARAARMTPERRSEIARMAAKRRWNKPP